MLYLSNVRAACCWRTSRRLRSRSAAPPPRRCVTQRTPNATGLLATYKSIAQLISQECLSISCCSIGSLYGGEASGQRPSRDQHSSTTTPYCGPRVLTPPVATRGGEAGAQGADGVPVRDAGARCGPQRVRGARVQDARARALEPHGAARGGAQGVRNSGLLGSFVWYRPGLLPSAGFG
jgi:hypothetical protein